MPLIVGDREIIERKHKPDGTVREYRCTAVLVGRRRAIIRFDLVGGGGAFNPPIEVPPGSVSYGYFWEGRPYGLYRFLRPDGGVLGHRFDAVGAVSISREAVEYRDLVLDWWVTVDGRLIAEDREEFEELAASGAMLPADIARAGEAARRVEDGYREIIEEVGRLERRHVLKGRRAAREG
jgi:hypothetical protein